MFIYCICCIILYCFIVLFSFCVSLDMHSVKYFAV